MSKYKMSKLDKIRIKILNKRINAIKTALENNDVEFIGKWHGTIENAEEDLEDLEVSLRSEMTRLRIINSESYKRYMEDTAHGKD